MADILFIKTSSLGDVIHHMPALTEARKALPQATFTWAGGGSLRPAGAPASGGERGDPGRLAALAQVARYAGDARPRSPAACAPSGRGATTRSSTARACCAPPFIARLAQRTPPRLRRRQHPRAARRDVLRRPPSRQPRSACGRAQPHPQRPGARLYAAGRARFRARPRALCRAGRALCRAAARHRAAEQGMAGSELDRARPGASRAHSDAALGHAKPSGRAASGLPPRCRARVYPNARRSMRWRG